VQPNRQQRRAAARATRSQPRGPATTVQVRSTGLDSVAITFLRPLDHGGPVTVDLTADQADQIAGWLRTASGHARTYPSRSTPAA
jgi:hypothetical protein